MTFNILSMNGNNRFRFHSGGNNDNDNNNDDGNDSDYEDGNDNDDNSNNDDSDNDGMARRKCGKSRKISRKVKSKSEKMNFIQIQKSWHQTLRCQRECGGRRGWQRRR